MAISGAIYSIGGFALLAFGLYWKRASRAGAYLALLTGFLAVLGLSKVQELCAPLLDPIKKRFEIEGDIPSAVIGLITLALAIVLMIAGSLLLPDKKRTITS
jgi:Na+/proline symporter